MKKSNLTATRLEDKCFGEAVQLLSLKYTRGKKCTKTNCLKRMCCTTKIAINSRTSLVLCHISKLFYVRRISWPKPLLRAIPSSPKKPRKSEKVEKWILSFLAFRGLCHLWLTPGEYVSMRWLYLVAKQRPQRLLVARNSKIHFFIFLAFLANLGWL